MLTSNMHGGLFIVMWIENLMNKIKFNLKNIKLLVIFLFFYLCINLLATLLDKPVYGPITWRNVISYLAGIVTIGCSVLHFYLGYIFYEKKKKTDIPMSPKL
jgi:hypothetical protein